jgi:hypothetical protein
MRQVKIVATELLIWLARKNRPFKIKILLKISIIFSDVFLGECDEF